MDRSMSPITLTEAAERLGVHYMTAYRYVRTGRLPAQKVGREWQVDPADVERLRAGGSDAEVLPVGRGRRRDRSSALVERMVRSDEAGAWTIVEAAVGGGMEPDRVYLDLLAPALAEVGERWERGELSIAQEHQASALALRLIGRLGPRFARRGRKRGTIVVGAPPNDAHGLPSALLSDLLRSHQFDVIDLGADVPIESWSSTCDDVDHLVAIGLCASTPDNDAAIRDTIAALRSVTTATIVLGGLAITDGAHALALGASVHSDSFGAAVELLAEQPPATGFGSSQPAS